jgi:hypothetical protein
MLASGSRFIYRWRAGVSLWRANAVTRAPGSESSRTDSTSRAECRGFRPGQRRTHVSADSRGWLLDEFKCREEIWLRRTRTSRDARWTADQGIDGVPGSLKPVHAPPGDPAFALRPGREYSLLEQDAEKVRQQRSRFAQRLNVEEEFLGGRKHWRGFSVRQDLSYWRTAHTKCGLYLLGPSLAAALLDSLFEHPAGRFSCCATCANYRSSRVPQ